MQVGNVVQIFRHFGPAWLLYRAFYSQQIRSGFFRAKLPAISWAETSLSSFLQTPALGDAECYHQSRQWSAPRFFFAPEELNTNRPEYAVWDDTPSPPTRVAGDLAQGRMSFFSHAAINVGFPPQWHCNYATQQQLDRDSHWSEIDDFQAGDIKLVWEPSRFAVTFALVRAFGRTGDKQHAELFWQLVESWRDENPPQLGANWKCGQEIALRVMAWCFGLYGFQHCAASTPQRVADLAKMIVVSGCRIETNLRYALSQRNNHGINEATALWTIGRLFPEFSRAVRWAQLGRRLLERQGRELIYDDGAFSQHSLNYQRVMLHSYLWSMRLGELHDQPFSSGLYDRIQAAGRFLYQLQDEQTGQVPNYGHNDGANILPLSNCEYQDFRPVVQATQFLTTRTRCLDQGPWDEDLIWLFGGQALSAPLVCAPRAELAAEDAGYYTLRSPAGFLMTRIPRFRHRPGQADALHVDLWWRGQNVAVDAGTYSYNAVPAWTNALARTEYHNTVSVDDKDQMDKIGRFLWMPWLRGQARARGPSSNIPLQYLEGEHDGYGRLDKPVQHRRAMLRLAKEHWLVMDRLIGDAPHQYRLHWLFGDFPFECSEPESPLCLELTTPVGNYFVQVLTSSAEATRSLIRADTDSPRGWQSRRYFERQPAVSLRVDAHAASVDFWTVLGPNACQVHRREQQLRLTSRDWEAELCCSSDDSGSVPLIRSVSLQGAFQQELVLE